MATPELEIILYITQLTKHKKMGCTMGTVCAPTYADVFMAQFQEKHTTHTSKICLSFISDILMTY